MLYDDNNIVENNNEQDRFCGCNWGCMNKPYMHQTQCMTQKPCMMHKQYMMQKPCCHTGQIWR